MFHVEHNSPENIIFQGLPGIDPRRLNLLAEYARLIHRENSRFNLTGFKTVNEITENLIIGSIKPLLDSDVPRGTFADIGTGSGTPGIPVSIFFPGLRGKLIDSNLKKIRFISDVIEKLCLERIEPLNARLESAGRDPLERETYDLVLSRALGSFSLVAELGSPLLKKGGLLYIYSGKDRVNLSRPVVDHCGQLSLEPVANKELGAVSGIIFRKRDFLDNKYPRKYPVIQREASKIDGERR